MDPETLKKALIKVDYRPVPNERIPFKAIRLALFGEEHAEKIRGMKLANNKAEREAKMEDGRLVPWELVEKKTNELLVLPLISALDAAPDDVSRDWIEKVVKPIMRQKMEPPNPETK